jgi:hypothetical protein
LSYRHAELGLNAKESRAIVTAMVMVLLAHTTA